MTVVPPGATVGVLGSGQLGRMFAIAARRMGYRVHTFSPDNDTPTGQVADVEITAPYEDLVAVRHFARAVDVVTFEFENVPAATVEAAASEAPVRPAGNVLWVSQQRVREKSYLSDRGLPVTPFARVTSLSGLHEALAQVGSPAVLKTAAFGYDGKGQYPIASPADADAVWAAAGGSECILEKRIAFAAEVSVIAARGLDGAFAAFPVFENVHRRHILDVTVCPARVAPRVAARAQEIGQAVLEALDVVGVLCVELFLTESGELLINEIAPRPHNSGHLTVDACVTSQFEQQLRAVCGLPLGSPDLIRPAAMANLLGEEWRKGEPRWERALAAGDVKLHLYGKTEARPGRKMGHLTALAASADEALDLVLAARESL